MIVLGIDPGSASTGFGILRFERGRMVCLESGAIRPSPRSSFPDRLKQVHDGIADLLASHTIDEIAVEDIFQGVNPRTAGRLGHVRGVILLAAARAELPISEYPPGAVKSSVAGNGQASKEQVRYMICQILQLKETMETLDESDALAVAICHCHRSGAGALR